GFRRLSQDASDYEIQLTNLAKQKLERFIKEKRLTQTRLTETVHHPITCCFENRVTSVSRGQKEQISQFHPLVRFVSASIDESKQQHRPAVALRLPRTAFESSLKQGVYILAVARWSVDGLQAVEK